MPRLLSRRRKGAGCGYHGWSCRLGGGSEYVSEYCCPVPVGVSLDRPATDEDPALAELLLRATARMRGITLDEARAQRARQEAEAQTHARRRARMSPAQRCADDDLTDDRVAAATAASRARVAAERDRKRAEIAAEAVPAVPEPATPGEPRSARSGRLSARPLRVVGGVYDDDDPDPRVIMYAR